jgi:hypothetical protein
MSSHSNPSQFLLGQDYLFLEAEKHDPERFSQSRGNRDGVYPYFSRIIELAWPSFIAKLNNDSDKVYSNKLVFKADKTTNLLDFTSNIQQLDSKLLQSIISKDPRRQIWTLRDSFALSASKNFILALEELKDHPAYISATNFVAKLDYYKNVEEKNRIIAMVHGGLYTAIYFNFDIIRVPAILYYRKFQKVMTLEQLSKTVMNSTKLLTVVASMHHDLRTSLREYARNKPEFTEALPPEREAFDYEFPLNFYQYDEALDQINFNSEGLAQWRKEVESSGLPKTQKLGCPSRHVKHDKAEGQSENVMISLLDSQLKFTLKYLTPALETYAKS